MHAAVRPDKLILARHKKSMSSEADRKRLLDLFREPLSGDDVIRTPDALSSAEAAFPPPPHLASLNTASYGSSAPSHPPYPAHPPHPPPTSLSQTFGISHLVGIGVILLLLGLVAYLLMRETSAPPPTTTRTNRMLTDDDDEIAAITDGMEDAGDVGDVPIQSGEVGEIALKRAARGMPQMGQMRPANLQSGGGTAGAGGSGAHVPRTKRAVAEDDDPMFQELDV